MAGAKLYVADTNNHKIRIVNLSDDAVTTLKLSGLTPPAAQAEEADLPQRRSEPPVSAEVKPGDSLRFDVNLPIGDDFKLNEEIAMPFLVEAPGVPDLVAIPVEPSKPEPPAVLSSRAS